MKAFVTCNTYLTSEDIYNLTIYIIAKYHSVNIMISHLQVEV